MKNTLQALVQISELLRPNVLDKSNCKRFGSQNDGGYILYDDLNDNNFLISFGVGDNVEFESQIATRGISAHLYDNSIVELPRAIPKAKFFKETIGPQPHTTLQNALARIPESALPILKMDIEGSEWETLNGESEHIFNRFAQLIVEFHNLSEVTLPSKAELMVSVLSKLNSLFFVANVHPNNNGDYLIIENVGLPDVLEVTYLNRQHYSFLINDLNNDEQNYVLNAPCNPHKPEIFLNFLDLQSYQTFELESLGVLSPFELNALRRKVLDLENQLFDLNQKIHLLNYNLALRTNQRDEILNSTTWRVTSPIRRFSEFIRRK